MKIADRDTAERLRFRFPAGSEVELVAMDDPQAPAPGTRGIVSCVDDAGTVHVHWNNGSCLGAVPEVDEILPVCPICKKAYSEHPALSRKDSKTIICPDCGLKEALIPFHLSNREIDRLIRVSLEEIRKERKKAKKS